MGGVIRGDYIQSLSEYYPTWARKRIELGIPLDAFMVVSVGELNKNKNNRVVIAALEKLHQKNIHYVLCGIGDQETVLKTQANAAGLQDNVHFLGFRNDVKEIYEMADCFVMPSYREGLSRSIMEAMANGLPCIVSKIRGNVDLIEEGCGGYLFDAQDVDEIVGKLRVLSADGEVREKMKKENLERIKKFDVKDVKKTIEEIYREVLV